MENESPKGGFILSMMHILRLKVSLSMNEKHKKVHCLVCCFPQYWHELEYVKNRRESNIDEYKSQEGRYLDPQ